MFGCGYTPDGVGLKMIQLLFKQDKPVTVPLIHHWNVFVFMFIINVNIHDKNKSHRSGKILWNIDVHSNVHFSRLCDSNFTRCVLFGCFCGVFSPKHNFLCEKLVIDIVICVFIPLKKKRNIPTFDTHRWYVMKCSYCNVDFFFSIHLREKTWFLLEQKII